MGIELDISHAYQIQRSRILLTTKYVICHLHKKVSKTEGNDVHYKKY